MKMKPQEQAVPAAFGMLDTDAPRYQPLSTVTVRIQGRGCGDSACTIRVCDPMQRMYFQAQVPLNDNRGQVTFTAAGPLGAHYVYLIWPGNPQHSRYVNFVLEAHTAVHSGDRQFDELYPFTRDRMLLGRRAYDLPDGKLVGYISADTLHFDGIWLRDSVYGLPAYQYWERDLIHCIERFLDRQQDDGQFVDGIERDGRTWRVGLESDVEYLLVLAVWQVWKATGDHAFAQRALPRLEKALAYVTSNPKRWDATHQLVKRQHSCDTWDFDIDGAGDCGDHRQVIANCDQSGYFQAFSIMSRLCRHLGESDKASQWHDRAQVYHRRANDLLWDGSKYLHHVHLDPIDHGDFDESQQLSMGNTWAMTRGLADTAQATRIIDEYHRRHRDTGDAYPWWSLQPGYPDHLGYWHQPFTQQGGYANGGLMPWVGGELCLAGFMHGRETYAVQLLRQYAQHLDKHGGAQVWYWPDGTPGMRTHNEINYAGWGMASWITALLEGLAGVHDDAGQLRHVVLSPRWPATDRTRAHICVRYAASQSYFAYRYSLDTQGKTIEVQLTGSGESVELRPLLPAGWRVVGVEVEGRALDHQSCRVDGSDYVVVPISAKVDVPLLANVLIRCNG